MPILRSSRGRAAPLIGRVGVTVALALLAFTAGRRSAPPAHDQETAALLRDCEEGSRLPVPTASDKQDPPAFHIGVALGLGAPLNQVSEFLNFLLPSWHYVTSVAREPNSAVIDLLVFCEVGIACASLPSACRPMLSEGAELFAHDNTANCWWHPQRPQTLAEWRDLKYMFMASIAFITERPFTDIADRYDLILRTDQDAFLPPSLATWRPPKGAAFGHVNYSSDTTDKRLPMIAAKLGLVHRGVSQICSGWLAPPGLTVAIANMTCDVGRHMLAHEYGKGVPGLEALPPLGIWPEWWRGVTSLYAAEIAINHLIPDLTEEGYITDRIDVATYLDMPLSHAVHIHAGHDGQPFDKFKFHENMPQQLATSAGGRASSVEALPKLSAGMTVRDYATAIVGSAVASAASQLEVDAG